MKIYKRQNRGRTNIYEFDCGHTFGHEMNHIKINCPECVNKEIAELKQAIRELTKDTIIPFHILHEHPIVQRVRDELPENAKSNFEDFRGGE